MIHVLRVAPVGLLIFASTVLCGCGGEKPPLVAVYGRVSYQGKPIPNLLVHFVPADGRPGVAVTDAGGSFPHVKYTRDRNGLLIGDYDIVLQYLPPEPQPGETRPATRPQPPDELRPLLEKYGDFSKPQIQRKVESTTRELVLELAD